LRTRLLLLAFVLLILLTGCGPAGSPAGDALAGAAVPVTEVATYAPLPTIAPSATPTPAATAMPTHTPTPEPTATPMAPAHLVASYPIDNDGAVLSGRPLVLVFDRPMDAASVEAGLVISPAVTGSIEWEGAEGLAFYPEGGWEAAAAAGGDAWEARVSAGVRAQDGGLLEEDYTVRFALSGRGSPIPVLMYHHVEDLGPDATEGKKDWTVSIDAFREQMAYLEEHGWTSISSTALAAYLLDGQPLPVRPVMISVDDGNRSFYQNGWPIIQETSLRPVMFLVPQFAEYSGYVNWDEMRALVAGGAWIGSHGYSHRNLREVPDSDLAWELGDSRAILEEQLGIQVDGFCFPYGGRNEAALAVIGDYYRTGYSLNPIYWQRPEEPFYIGRLRVDYRTTMEDFSDLLPGE